MYKPGTNTGNMLFNAMRNGGGSSGFRVPVEIVRDDNPLQRQKYVRALEDQLGHFEGAIGAANQHTSYTHPNMIMQLGRDIATLDTDVAAMAPDLMDRYMAAVQRAEEAGYFQLPVFGLLNSDPRHAVNQATIEAAIAKAVEERRMQEERAVR